MEHDDNEQRLMTDVDPIVAQPQSLEGVHAPASLVPSVLSRLSQVNASIQPGNQADSLDRLLNALKDADWHVRATAVRLLGKPGERTPLEPLLAALNDEDESVRLAAVRTLGIAGEQAPIDRLIGALRDPAWSVRETAALTLGTLGERVPEEPLKAIMNNEAEDAFVREAANWALQQAHPAVLPALASDIINTPQTPDHYSGETDGHLHERARSYLTKLIGLSKRLSGGNAIGRDWQGESDMVEIPNLDDAASSSNALQHSVPADPKPHLVIRIGEGVLAALLIAGIALSWLALAHRSHPSSSGSFSHPRTTATATPSISSPLTGHAVSLTIAGGVIYAGTVDNAVYALRASDGTLLWRFTTSGSVDESPLVVNGVVYVSTYVNQGPGTVYALRASDGTLLWHFTRTGFVYRPTVVDGVAYIGSGDDTIYALRASDGILLWRFTTSGSAGESPLVVNGVVYVSTYVDQGPGTAYALRASNGTLLWHFTFTRTGFVFRPIVVDGVAYIDSPDGLVALRASDGTLLWRYALDSISFLPPIVLNGVVYTIAFKISPAFTSTNGSGGYLARFVPGTQTIPFKSAVSSVYALRASDGMPLWHYTMNNGKNSWGTLFSVVNGVIYAGATADVGKNSIYALRASDGSLLWHSTTDDAPTSALVANGVAYTGSNSGAVYALRASDGSLLWHSIIIGQVFVTPMLASNLIYVSAINGIVYAFQANNGSLLWYYQTAING